MTWKTLDPSISYITSESPQFDNTSIYIGTSAVRILSVDVEISWDTAPSGYPEIVAGRHYKLNGFSLAGHSFDWGYSWAVEGNYIRMKLIPGMKAALDGNIGWFISTERTSLNLPGSPTFKTTVYRWSL